MIESIRIENIALIDQLDLELYKGFNVLTGETGTGKSILLSAIRLILGEKADPDILRMGAEKGVVELRIDLSDQPKSIQLFQERGLANQYKETEEETKKETGTANQEQNQNNEEHYFVFRKELQRNGKTRCFINSKSVSISLLKDCSERLIEISSQHAHQFLLKNSTHLEILDRFARLDEEVNKLSQNFQTVKKLVIEEKDLLTKELEKEKRLEWIQFSLQELSKAQLQVGEEDELEKELLGLTHFERLSQSVHNGSEILYQEEDSIQSRVEILLSSLEEVSEYDSRILELCSEIREALYHLENAQETIRSLSENLEYSPERLEEIQNRLEEIQNLKRKYSVQTLLELLKIREEYIHEKDQILFDQDRIQKLRTEIETKQKQILEQSIQLSEKRQKQAKILEKQIQNEFSFLGMEKSRFQIVFRHILEEKSFVQRNGKGVKVSEKGIDQIEFLFSANPGEELKPLVKIASGGELSRVMLAMKSILSEWDNIGTLLFDELDSGIGGEIANQVGEKIKILSEKRQVLCITHSPTIASRCDHHFFVAKFSKENRTKSFIRELTEKNERIREIARMLSGETLSEVSLNHARELLERTTRKEIKD